MAFLEQLLLFLLSFSSLGSAGTLAEVHQTSSPPRTDASHGAEVHHLSRDTGIVPEILSAVNRKEVALPSQTPEDKAGNRRSVEQNEVQPLFSPDPLLADMLLEDKRKLSSNFLTPVNPFWTELPPEKVSPSSSMLGSSLLETESSEEPFQRPTQLETVTLDHRQGSALELASSVVSPMLSEESSSLTSVSSLPTSGSWQLPQSTFESEFPDPAPSVELPSSIGPALDVQPSTAWPKSSGTRGSLDQSPQGGNQDNSSPVVGLTDHSLIYDLGKDTGIAATNGLQQVPSKETTPDVIHTVPALPGVQTSSPVMTADQDALTATPGATDDGPPAGAASVWPACDQEQGDGCGPATTQSTTEATADAGLYFLRSPPLFIPLHADWNAALADWGLAWEVHVYGVGSLFGCVAFLSLLSLLCLPFRCPSGCRFFVVLDLLLISVGCSRAFALFYDAYSHQERLPAFSALLLYDVVFPCLASSLGVVFLLLSMRSRTQLSHSRYQHPCALAAIVFLHFFISMGAIIVVHLLHQFPFLLFVSRGVFVACTAVLSVSFFIFYCLMKPDPTQIYDLKCSLPHSDYQHRCPFANSEDWNRAARTALFSAIFGLFNAGLQLYAMLYALGYGGTQVFSPWPWWAVQLGFRLCEVGMGLPLAVLSMYPVFCSHEIPRFQCWTKFFCLSPGHVNMKAPILPNNYQWASSQHEKLMICETIARSDSEFFPLYTLVGKRFSIGEDHNLMYHSNKSMGGSDLNLKDSYGSKASSFISVPLDSDSTGDFRPPSPINLRRSIDEALFGEALILKSLFPGAALSSSLSLNIKSLALPDSDLFKEKAADRGLYRTSSCMEMETALPMEETDPQSSRQNTMASSPGCWRRGSSRSSSLYKLSLDGSSLVLCSSPEKVGYASSFSFDAKTYKNLSQANLSRSSQAQGQYRALPPPSQESLDLLGHRSMDLQAELMDVCRQIDTFSVGSDTIDL